MHRLAILPLVPLAALGASACGSDGSSDATTPTDGPGTLTLVYRPSGADDPGDLTAVATAVGDALTAAGYVARASVTSDLTIEVRNVTTAERDAVVAAVGLDASRVLVRPVVACPAVADATSIAPADGSELVPFIGGGECAVGPAAAEGGIFRADAAAEILGSAGWGVTAQLRDGADGADVFNALAASCFAGDSTCPSHQIAIEIDGSIVTAPTVQAPEFSTGAVQIAGTLSEVQASALAAALVMASAGDRLTLDDESFAAG